MSGETCVQEEEVTVAFVFPNGDRYEGKCIVDESGAMKRSGAGKHSSADGSVYTGEWHKDKMHGTGTLHFPSGAFYKGEFKDNMFHGTGAYTFPNGCVYNGQFYQNRLEGNGAFADAQGLVWAGEFHGETALGLKLQESI